MSNETPPTVTITCLLHKKLPSLPPPLLPTYAHEGDAGMDLRAAISEPWHILSGSSELIPTGIAFSIPIGYEGQVRSRSGLAAKNQVVVLNSPGTIDSGFRGEIKVILFNAGTQTFTVNPGDRIAQIVFAPVVRAILVPVGFLNASERGESGFGSTGIASDAASAFPVRACPSDAASAFPVRACPSDAAYG